MAGELGSLEGGEVGLFGQTAALAQAVDQVGVTWPVGQPRQLQVPQLGEGRVVEGNPPVGPEHHDGVGQALEHRLLRRLRPAEGLGGGLGLGDVVRPNAGAAAGQWLGCEAQGAAAVSGPNPTDHAALHPL